tara:strand:+ start:2601 stop:3221 length:621 start_codon:yes stop_codon:yes gene_type:complete
MAFDVEAAKADGYTDEEIAAHLRGQTNTPVPVQEQPSRAAEMTATLGGTAVGYAPEVLGTAALGYGLYKYGPDMARTAGNIVSKMSSLRSSTPPSIGTAANPIGGPVAPPAMTPPPAPAPAPTPAQPSMIQQGMEYANKVRQIAMDKVMQNAGTIRNVGVGALAATMPANQNQNYPVPQKGPYRGMEINPMTNRPWTQQELMQINR